MSMDLFLCSVDAEDIIDEAVYYFKANVFFKNYEIKVTSFSGGGNGDRGALRFILKINHDPNRVNDNMICLRIHSQTLTQSITIDSCSKRTNFLKLRFLSH